MGNETTSSKFKINHFANTFFLVEAKDSSIACDPWVGKTTDNGWFSYPIKNTKEIENRVFNSNFIYISHLHCDHLDFKTLKKFKNKNLTFIIKKFENGHLKKKLQKFTNKKIIELEPFKKKKINKDFTIAIIPATMTNSGNLPDHIQYDLDTAIIIQSNQNKTLFYNNVDMPLNLDVLKKVNNFIKKEFKKKVDVFCCALGAASEFPQCFLNLNRNNEKKKIISETLNAIQTYLKYLKPKIYFPGGGTYAIYGKYNKLNKFIAQPSFSQVKSHVNNVETKLCKIIGGGSITFDKSKYTIIEKINSKEKKIKQKFINQIKDLSYYYSYKNKKININKLDKTFLNAEKNYQRILSKKKIDTKWNIDFNIFRKLELNDNCKINKKKSKFIKKYNLKNYNSKSKDAAYDAVGSIIPAIDGVENKEFKKGIFNLECFMEYQLFNSLLMGKFPWNTSLSGSTIMYNRNPNKFNVDMVFSLNFLRI